MRKMKSRIAVLTAMLVAAATCIRPSAAYAQGEETQNQGTEEYIIMAKNDDAMENITNEYDNVLEEEMSDTSVTDEENVAVVELTAKEAADLKKDSDTV